jgi:hypothetical protein
MWVNPRVSTLPSFPLSGVAIRCGLADQECGPFKFTKVVEGREGARLSLLFLCLQVAFEAESASGGVQNAYSRH